MVIVQISDCHVVSPERRAYGRVDTAGLLRRAVEAINALPQGPDVIMATGDLVQSGTAEEYATFLEITAALPAPVLPVVGNHDLRDTLAQAFGLESRVRLQPGFIQYAIEDYPMRILVIDTHTPGSSEPSLCAERLAWIERRLAEDTRPTFIAMHHPPFPSGVAWMEPKQADWAQPLCEIIARHSSVVRLACGHVHRPTTVCWAGTCAMSAPSTAHQVFPDLTPAARPRFNLEAPGFLLHQWTGTDLISYGLAIPGIADTIELSR